MAAAKENALTYQLITVISFPSRPPDYLVDTVWPDAAVISCHDQIGALSLSLCLYIGVDPCRLKDIVSPYLNLPGLNIRVQVAINRCSGAAYHGTGKASTGGRYYASVHGLIICRYMNRPVHPRFFQLG